MGEPSLELSRGGLHDSPSRWWRNRANFRRGCCLHKQAFVVNLVEQAAPVCLEGRLSCSVAHDVLSAR